MEDKVTLSQLGQEVQQGDFNLVGEEGALADDRILAELLRLAPMGGSVSKAVIPFAVNPDPGGISPIGAPPNSPLVRSSAAADATIIVHPFRAIVGSRVAMGTSVKQNWRDIRSAIALGASAANQSLQLAATSANHRWDLIYARVDVDIDGPSVTRYVKAAGGSVSAQSIAVLKRTTVTIDKVQGVEGASPSRPAVPTDSGSAFYVPLAYVFLPHPHTLTSTISKLQIHEPPPCSPISRAFGVRGLYPANHLHKVGGTLFTQLADFGSGPSRPVPYLPSNMAGGDSRIIQLFWDGGNAYPTINATSLLDDSIDWRQRYFKWHAHAFNAGKFPSDATAGTRVPGFDSQTAGRQAFGMGQSFFDDGTAIGATGGGVIARLIPTFLTQMAGSSEAIIFVDLSTGELKCRVFNVHPQVTICLWLDATGPFGNG